MTDGAPAAFPRGKRKKPAAAAPAPKDDGRRPSKKRAAASSGSAPAPGEKEFLFGGDELDPALRRKRPSRRDPDAPVDSDDDIDPAITSQLPLGGGAVLPPATTKGGRRVPPRIEPLTFSKFAKGTKVLGALKEVHEEYALVGLPTMLTGYVRREEGGPPLTRVLPPADTILAFSVVSTEVEEVSKKEQKQAAAAGKQMAKKKRRIELSPLPSQVNRGVRLDGRPKDPVAVRGRIISVEDHGCIVDLGGVLGAGRAFLRFENVEGDYEVDDGDGDEESEDEDDDEEEKKERMDTDEKAGGVKRRLNPHRVYDFTILPSNSEEDSILQLALPSPAALASLRAPPAAMPGLSSLLPGTLAEVRVEAHARNGLCVSFHRGVYRGSIDEDHLGGHRGADAGGKKEKDGHDGMWWKGVFKGRRTKFTARIIAVDAATKIIRFSLNPQILALNGDYTTFPHPVGAVVKNAQVIRVDPGIGALLALPPADSASSTAEDSDHGERIAKMDRELSNNLLSNPEYQEASRVRVAYVHISKSMDVDDDSKSSAKKGKQKQGKQRAPEALFARRFSINTRIPSLRILSAPGPLDGIAACATAKSIVGAHVLTHADVKPGMFYKDVPVSQLLESGGVLVDLGPGTRGIVPASHLFDRASRGTDEGTGLSGYRQKVRSAKYKVGSRIAVRCLTVDPAARQCVLTAKKTLLANDVDDPIVDYPSVAAGRVAAGFVTKVEDTGLTVTFYNNVHGRVTSRSLAAELGVEDVRKNYGVGDVVLARVVSCERRRNRHVSHGDGEEYYYQLRLSLKTVVEEKKEAREEEGAGAPTSSVVAAEGDTKDSTVVPLAAGSVLMKKRMKVLQLVNSLHRHDGVFLPGYAIVSIKSKFLVGQNSDASAVECKLPYEQLLDSYGDDLSDPPIELDAIARGKLRVGKRVDEEGLVLAVPAGTDALPVVSLRSSLIETAKKKIASPSADDFSIVCPSPKSNIFMGEYVRGYVARIDKRFGAFVRFLDGLTGLIPKLKKGLDENLYDTIVCKVTALDITSSPPKILLKRVSESEVSKKKKKKEGKNKATDRGRGGRRIQVGDVVGDVKVADINFARAKVFILDDADSSKIRARIHVTMADAIEKTKKLSKKDKRDKEEHKIGKLHPFYSWNIGDVIPNVRCVAVDDRDGVTYVELSNLPEPLPSVVNDPSHLPTGSIVSAIVTSVSSTPHHGLWVQVCPGISGFVPALELSMDPGVLNDLPANYKVGTRITTCVMQKMGPYDKKLPRRPKLQTDEKANEHQALELSALLVPGDDDANTIDKHPSFKPTKPRRGDSVLGCVNTKSRMVGPPSLMLNLRGGYVGRCCITELADKDDWENMPLGKTESVSANSKGESTTQQQRVVSSDSDADHSRENEDEEDASDNEDDAKSGDVQSDYPNGKYVKCRVLGNARSKGAVELSLRESRCQKEDQDSLEPDPIPKTDEVVCAFVVSTTKKGCFVRLSRSVEGRVILKELSESYVPDPGAMFPQGRLVVGKVKNVKTPNHSDKKGNQFVAAMVDIDMRESRLLTGRDSVTMESIEINSKYTGVITRVESYGVFVRIDNSNVSGLAHVSECSDNYIKSLDSLYSPGDLVKLMVIKIDKEKNQLGFSLKASNFVDDDSDDESTSSSGSESSSDEMDEDGDAIDSEDDDFATKLAEKMKKGEGMEVDEESAKSVSSSEDSSSDSESESSAKKIKKGEGMEVDEESAKSVSSSEGSSSDSESESSDSEEDDSDEGPQKGKSVQMETDVGFDWGGSNFKTKQSTEESSDDNSSSSSDSSDDEGDDADSGLKSSNRARKKAAAKRRDEEETYRREADLADGTADETPETSADFERLVASSPNSSEVWIRYMAFHLSLADVDAARIVANRAVERIEFRQEGEKLNVWTALLTLELKYGTSSSLHNTLDRASSTNNPKQVYLRLCELLEKEVDSATSSIGSSDLSTATSRADDMFTKMCKKFKSKKSVWIANFKYLLKGSRHEEAHALLKRSLQSLPAYKHVEVMSKFAQMEFELGSPERGRTIFNALLAKYPKRMDLLFVNIDKEVKNGDIAKARALFDSVVNPVSRDFKFKFSDKQMKSLFKKWYRIEEDHGDEESQERVREEARSFVAKSTP